MLVQHAPKNSNRAVQKNSFDVMLRQAVSSSIVKNPRDLPMLNWKVSTSSSENRDLPVPECLGIVASPLDLYTVEVVLLRSFLFCCYQTDHSKCLVCWHVVVDSYVAGRRNIAEHTSE